MSLTTGIIVDSLQQLSVLKDDLTQGPIPD